MKNGILRDDEGFDIMVNDATRAFRDTKDAAYAAARVIKRKNRGDIVQIVDRSSGAKVLMLDDGRTG